MATTVTGRYCALPEPDGAWLAPAKLNLMLRVLGRRADGYHRLQTVFQFIDRCDRLYFEVLDRGRVERAGDASGIPVDRDLTVRAARSLQAATGCRHGVRISLTKQLPIGGGLGGGSSDAATTLLALNRLWHLGLDNQQLSSLGLALGADVPVFVHGEASWAEGIGERLQRLDLPQPWYLVLTPPCAVSTEAVFKHPELTRNSAPATMADFVAGSHQNDCLSVVLKEYPEVYDAFQWLKMRAAPRLTGTGGCVFSSFENRRNAMEVLEAAPARFNAFVARGCNYSPLFKRIA